MHLHPAANELGIGVAARDNTEARFKAPPHQPELHEEDSNQLSRFSKCTRLFGI
jgi:hypothetical protein